MAGEDGALRPTRRVGGLSTGKAGWLAALLAVSAVASCTLSPREGLPQQRGRETFTMVCSSCHGQDARGRGPVADVLKVPVPDLTRIAARRGGAFPTEEIFRIVDGQAPIAAHGTREMPIWGYEFFGTQADDREAHDEAVHRIEDVVEYLGSIQRGD